MTSEPTRLPWRRRLLLACETEEIYHERRRFAAGTDAFPFKVCSYWARVGMREPSRPASLGRRAFPAAVAQTLPDLRREGGAFADMAAPEEDPAMIARGDPKRGAVFFDRDGVLNFDNGYTYDVETFRWRPGAREAIRLVNDCGLFVFVVTNQSGVARGLYGEEDVRGLHAHMQADLRRLGAHIDDFRYCPHHPEAKIAAYRQACDCRKPAPGMIRDLMACWPVEPAESLLVGDQESDVAAATAAGVTGWLVDATIPLDTFVARALAAPGISRGVRSNKRGPRPDSGSRA